MRKQKLPPLLWTNVPITDKQTYCFWYDKNSLKRCVVQSEKEARAFITRANDKRIAAFASTFIEEENENQVFACSFHGVLETYASKDYIQLEIAGANYKLLHYPEKKANTNATNRSIEQWSFKEYHIKYENAEYYVSWYDTSIHKFFGEKFASFTEANNKFNEKKNNDIPVRLSEYNKAMQQIHEIKAACQHWHIGMGKYLEQAANKTLPLGEIAYIFSNRYLTSELEVYGDYGFLHFNVGFEDYSIQIGKFLNGMSVNIDSNKGLLYHVNIDENPITEPWLARIQRQWGK